MRKIILLLFLFIFQISVAQKFQKQWKQVMQLELDGKVKTANELVSKIYKNASKKNASEDIIRCFLYQSKYNLILEENAQTKILANLDIEIAKAKPASKAILNFIYADILQEYFKQNQYQLRNRKETTDTLNPNFKLWNEDDFKKVIYSKIALTSVNNEVLKNTSLDNYKELIKYYKVENTFENSVYDFLLERKIAFFEEWIKSYSYRLDEKTKKMEFYFLLNKDFLSFDFSNSNDGNLKQLLQILQEKERYIQSKYPKLLEETIVDRMVLLKSILGYSKSFYKQLSKLENESSNEYLNQYIKANLADYLCETSETSNLKVALKISDSILIKKANLSALSIAENVKNKITEKNLSVQIAEKIYPNQKFKAFIQYKNIDTVFLKFYKIPIHIVNQSKIKDSISKIASKFPVVFETCINLPNLGDFKYQSTEILMPNLDLGTYFIEIFTKNQGEKGDYVAESQILKVSNLTYLIKNVNKEETYQIFNSKSGKPIESAIVNNNIKQGITNKDGLVSLPITKKSYYGDNSVTTFIKENDTLVVGLDYYKTYTENNLVEPIANVQTYLDRAIYRPGQKVSFKTILAYKINGKTKLAENTKFLATIEDKNGKEIYIKEAITNEFGSFSDTLSLPKNVLNGDFTLTISEAEKDAKIETKEKEYFWNLDFQQSEFIKRFSIEEYKRPTFYITALPITQNYKIGDSVSLKFNAKTYSGVSIANADVTYNLYKSMHSEIPIYANFEENYLNVKSKTDNNGDFEIKFIATDSLKSTNLNYVHANVKAEVTDSNGETHNIFKTITIRKERLQIRFGFETEIFKENKNTIYINTTTLNNFPIEAKGVLEIYEVQSKSYFIPKNNGYPTINTIPKEEFKKLFPYESYSKQDLDENIVLIKIIPFDTKKRKTEALDFLKNRNLGKYKIVASALDMDGNKIETTNYFKLNSKINPDTNFNVINYTTDYSKSNKIVVKVFSQIQDLTINCIFSVKNQPIEQQNITLKNGYAEINFAKEVDLESFDLNFFSFWENNLITESKSYTIKTNNTNLDIETIHFKDKLEPGSEEKWSFKIKNSKLEAEVLANMYDISLDQLKMDGWQMLQFYENNNSRFVNNQYTHNNSSNFYNFRRIKKYPYTNIEKFDFNYFGFDFLNNKYSRKNIDYKLYREQELTVSDDFVLLTGKTKDSIGLLPFTHISIEGKSRSTFSDVEGNFELKIAIGEIIVISSYGHELLKLKYKGEKQMTFILKKEDGYLDEVVITAFGIKRETKKLSYSTQKVSEDNSVYNMAGSNEITAMQGKVSGLNVITRNNGVNPNTSIILRGYKSLSSDKAALLVIDGKIEDRTILDNLNPDDILNIEILKGLQATALYGSQAVNGAMLVTTKNGLAALTNVKTRTNFNETAFFYPNLKTDKDGKISFSFTTQESLTKWKLRLFAHNKNVESGYFQTEVITQKQLSITPNIPRFLREKDTIILNAKISNLSNEKQNGTTILQFFDAVDGSEIKNIFIDKNALKNFSVLPNQTAAVSWKITIPEGLQGLNYKIIAKTNQFSDGEENTIPVLANKILITESQSLFVKANESKTYTLPESWNNKTATKHQLVLNFTNQPIWTIIEALPYLLNYEHECSEQTFARYFAGVLATEIIKSQPKVAEIIEKWRTTELPKSKLKLNEELKQIALAETPWLLDNSSEEEKNKQFANLMDLENLDRNNETTWKKFEKKQLENGAFCWFDGGKENKAITNYLVSGLGQIVQKFSTYESKFKTTTSKAIVYLDSEFLNERNSNKLTNYVDIDYLYSRSFFLKSDTLSIKISDKIKTQLAVARTNWLSYSLLEKAKLALILNRFDDTKFAEKIVNHFKDTSSNIEDFGMYWIENDRYSSSFNSSISVQSVIIQAFAEITNDQKSIELLKTWLLRNKQTNSWNTTKSTTEAVMAMVINGISLSDSKNAFSISVGKEKINSNEVNKNDGNFKKVWLQNKIPADLKTIFIDNKADNAGFGGVYLQYFQNLEDIAKSDKNALTITKKIFKKVSTSAGEKLELIGNNSLKIGDLVTMQLRLTATENLEFIHIKDLRASCFEPTSVLSGYEWEDNLSYYKTTKDVSTNFFIENLSKGSYILEYDVRVTNLGSFNDGIAFVQSMYAPEFTAHSASQKIKVE